MKGRLGVLAAVLAIAALGVTVWWSPWQAKSSMFSPHAGVPPSGSAVNGVAIIEAVKAGHRGKHGGTFTYRVRLNDGTEGEITIGEVFSPGTRLRLLYTHAQGSQLSVHAYEQCNGACTTAAQ